MDMMKPITSTEIPYGKEWVYEVKYDGFRCVLTWDKDGSIQLTSKNRKDLTENFPEIITFCRKKLQPSKRLSSVNNRRRIGRFKQYVSGQFQLDTKTRTPKEIFSYSTS